MTNITWDLNISQSEFKKVLKKPKDPRFFYFLARVFARVPFYEIFDSYLRPHQFKKYYKKIRKYVDHDPLGAGRIAFWDWLYRRLKS